ncbi:MAG: hypothetical protein FWG63_07365 [Defluviitaleaceae bacterium]|nr:hypothetical protein [Defluviitaleaceae bacterium]
MSEQIKYVEETDAPDDVRESFDRAVIVPSFNMTPEGIKAFGASGAMALPKTSSRENHPTPPISLTTDKKIRFS